MSKLAFVLGALAWLLLAPQAQAQSEGAQAALPADRGSLIESDVMYMAIDRNPSLRAALLELQSARLAVESEDARFTPVLLLDASLTRSESPLLTSTGTRVRAGTSADTGVAARKSFAWGTDLTLRLGGTYELSDSFGSFGTMFPTTLARGPGYGLNARLTLAQPLLRGAGRQIGEAELRAARIRRSTAEHTRDRVASELLRSVLSAYWDLWLARASLAIEERSRTTAIAQRDDAKARAETGSLAPANVLTFETAVAARDESVLSARTDVERKRVTLRQRIGAGVDDTEHGARSAKGVALLGDPSELAPPEIVAPPQDARAAALADSPLVHERAASVLLAETQARTADDPLRPRLDLEAYLQAEGLGNNDVGAAAEGFVTGQAISAHVGLVYEMPFSSTRQHNASARARLAIEVARAQLDEAKESVLAELDVALTELSAGTERVTLAQRTVEIAQQQLAAELARLSAGATTPLAIVQAEEDLRSAQLRVVQARAALVQTSLTVDHLTGRLLARHAVGLVRVP